MATLTKDAILSASDLQREKVSVPEWGGEVWVRTLTGKERDQLEASVVEMKGKVAQANLVNLRAKMCALCMVDDEGTRLFGEADIDALGGKSASALDRVFSVAQKLNGMSADDVEALTKN